MVAFSQGWCEWRPFLPSSTAWAWCHQKGNKQYNFPYFQDLLPSPFWTYFDLSLKQAHRWKQTTSRWLHSSWSRSSTTPGCLRTTTMTKAPSTRAATSFLVSYCHANVSFTVFWHDLILSPWLICRASFVFRHCHWLQDLPPYRVWFLPVQPCRHQGKWDVTCLHISIYHLDLLSLRWGLKWSLLSVGHEPPRALPCPVGWEQLHCWWTADPHQQPLLHVSSAVLRPVLIMFLINEQWALSS